MATETEIKLRWDGGADSAREMLDRHGYQVRTSRQLERDQIYDHAKLKLREAGKLLRLRLAGGRWVLTYKGPVYKDADGSAVHKSREEIESEIGDGAALELVLERLGYQPGFTYEKFRTTYILNDGAAGIVTLDETPIGDYLELEGEGSWIDETARTLGFQTDEYITASYAALYRQYMKEHIGSPANMTF